MQQTSFFPAQGEIWQKPDGSLRFKILREPASLVPRGYYYVIDERGAEALIPEGELPGAFILSSDRSWHLPDPPAAASGRIVFKFRGSCRLISGAGSDPEAAELHPVGPEPELPETFRTSAISAKAAAPNSRTAVSEVAAMAPVETLLPGAEVGKGGSLSLPDSSRVAAKKTTDFARPPLNEPLQGEPGRRESCRPVLPDPDPVPVANEPTCLTEGAPCRCAPEQIQTLNGVSCVFCQQDENTLSLALRHDHGSRPPFRGQAVRAGDAWRVSCLDPAADFAVRIFPGYLSVEELVGFLLCDYPGWERQMTDDDAGSRS